MTAYKDLKMIIRELIYLFMGVLFLLYGCEQDQTKYPLLGTDAIEDIAVNEESSHALIRWAERGFKNALLIHVDPADALKTVPEEHASQLRELITDKNWIKLRESAGSLFDDSNYVYAAARLDIVSKVYWIMPYVYFKDFLKTQKQVEDFLTNSRGFSMDDVKDMKMTGGCLTGKISGIDTSFCSSRTLPDIQNPVLLNINISYFPVYADQYRTSKLRALKWFFDELPFKRNVRVLHGSISNNIVNGITKPVHLYIGEELMQGLKNPEILKADSPPELWQFRDMAENMLSGGEDELVLEYLNEPTEKYPDDLSLRLLHAEALLRTEKYDEALKAVDEICSTNRSYCYGFVYLGQLIGDTERNRWRETFFQKAREALPESEYVRKTVEHSENVP